MIFQTRSSALQAHYTVDGAPDRELQSEACVQAALWIVFRLRQHEPTCVALMDGPPCAEPLGGGSPRPTGRVKRVRGAAAGEE